MLIKIYKVKLVIIEVKGKFAFLKIASVFSLNCYFLMKYKISSPIHLFHLLQLKGVFVGNLPLLFRINRNIYIYI